MRGLSIIIVAIESLLLFFVQGLGFPSKYVSGSRLIVDRIISIDSPHWQLRLTNTKIKCGPITNSNEHRRRVKKNKYAQYSKSTRKKTLESIEEAMRKSKEREIEELEDPGAAVRGTTVPTLSASPKITKNRAKFDNYRTIVPSDPLPLDTLKLEPSGFRTESRESLRYPCTILTSQHVILKKDELLYIKKPSRRSPRPIRIASARKRVKDEWLVRFEYISNRASAAAYRNFKVYVRAENRPKTAPDEYLVRDLVGLECLVKADGEDWVSVAWVHGVVPPEELCDPAVRHLMHAQLELQLHTSKKLCLIPLVPAIVVGIDTHQGQVLLDPPPGLFDLTYDEKPRRVVVRGFLPLAASLSDENRRRLGG